LSGAGCGVGGGFDSHALPPFGSWHDGKTDPAILRSVSGNAQWAILGSSIGQTFLTFGYDTDIPVPRDYNGDGKVEVAVARPASGNLTWYFLTSSSGSFSTVTWGLSTDKPVPADYNGDGEAEVAVFRPSTQPGTSSNRTRPISRSSGA
jgi:hypothetical protein